MSFAQTVLSRRSIRGYKPDPVPKSVIDEIVNVAQWAPSSMNTQPWHLHVYAAEAMKRLPIRLPLMLCALNSMRST